MRSSANNQSVLPKRPAVIAIFINTNRPHYNDNADLLLLIISLYGVGLAGDFPYELPKLVNNATQLESAGPTLLNAAAGVSYYRLLQADKDGHTALSKVIAINNSKAGVYLERYPNPVHTSLKVTVQGNANGSLRVIIADMQGKAIMQQQWQKNQSFFRKIIDVSSLQNGFYHIIIINGGAEKQLSSFVKY